MPDPAPDPADFMPRYAIVTGGSSGIGRSTCIALAETLKVDVGFTYHSDLEGAKATAGEIEKRGQRAIYRQADFSQVPGSADVVDELADNLRGVDVFVANAGMEKPSPVLDMSFENWVQTLNVCLTGAFLTMQRAARRMVKQGGGGRIIAVTSVHEHVPQPEGVAYVAAKHGLGGVVKNMALELTPRHGITVNAVAPGEINVSQTNLSAYIDKQDEGIRQIHRPAIPAGRPGYPREVADAICFLASAQSSYVNGASWRVDGGFETMTTLASGQYRDKYLPSAS